MSINSRSDEEFTRMPPGEEEPLLKRNSSKPRKFILVELYEQRLKPRLTPETLRIIMFFGLLVLFGIANSISGRWNQVKFGDRYAFFNNQFTTLVYAIFAQVITSYKYYFTSDITDEMKAFPKWKFVMFGFFDGLSAFLFSIGAPATAATLQNILNQTIIPFTMLASFIILSARYPWSKLLGATIIIAGAVVAFIPVFLGKKQAPGCPAPPYNGTTSAPMYMYAYDMLSNLVIGSVSGNDTTSPLGTTLPPGTTSAPGAKFIWYLTLIYFLNNIPAALSNVTKEMAFNNTPMDVYYLGSWVAWFQLFFSLCFLPVTNLKPFGGIPWSAIPDQMLAGLKCFAGINSVLDPNAPDGYGADNCSFNYIATSSYIVINFFYNIFILLVTKYASATLFTLAFALRLPVTQMLYCLHFIMSCYAEYFTWESIVSLVVVLGGFGIYSLIGGGENTDEQGKPPGEDEEVRLVPAINARGHHAEFYTRVRVPIRARPATAIRKTYLNRLGIDRWGPHPGAQV